MLFNKLSSQNGSLILSFLLSLAGGVAVILTVSVLERSTAEIQRHKSRIERDKLQRLLGDLLIRPTCTCQFQGLTVNPSAPEDLNLPLVRSGCDLTSTDNQIFATGREGVTGIRIANMARTGFGTMTAELIVQRDVDAPALAPIRVPLSINFDPGAAAPQKPITSCSATSTSSNTLQACPTGFVLVGDPGLRSSFCVQQVPSRGNYGEHYTYCLQPTDRRYGFAVKCFNADWYRACRSGAFTVAIGQWEWTLGNAMNPSPDTTVVTSGYGAVLGGGPTGCNSTGARPLNESNYIRCCIYNGL